MWGFAGIFGKNFIKTTDTAVSWTSSSREGIMERLNLNPATDQKGMVVDISASKPIPGPMDLIKEVVVTPDEERVSDEQETIQEYPTIQVKFGTKTPWFWKSYAGADTTLQLTFTRTAVQNGSGAGAMQIESNTAYPAYSTATSITAADLDKLVNGNLTFTFKDTSIAQTPIAPNTRVEFKYSVSAQIKYDGGASTEDLPPKSDSCSWIRNQPPSPEKEAFYKSSPAFWSELKQGSPGNETFEAMAGTPTTRNLYFSTGGSEFIIDLHVMYHENKTAVRKYQDTFTPVLCDKNTLPHSGHGHGCRNEIIGYTSPAPPASPQPIMGCTNPCDGALHRPCNLHTLPQQQKPWDQTITYDTVQIEDVHIWKIDRAKLDGMAELTGTDEVTASIVQGNPTVFYNKASNTSVSGRLRYSLKGNEQDTPSWTQVSNNSCTNQDANNTITNNAHKALTGTVTMISDVLILQTSSGDQCALYFQKTSPSAAANAPLNVEATWEEMWINNPNSASSWTEDEINIGGYNGQYRTPSTKYQGSGSGSTVATIFDGAQAYSISRPSRPSGALRLMNTNIDVTDTIPNREYVVGSSSVFYKLMLNNGNDNIYPTTLDSTYMDTGVSFGTAYSDDHSKINDVVIHNPVSMENAIVIPLDDSRDQRSSGSIVGGNPSPDLEVCPHNPGDCEFRRLTCTYGQDYMSGTLNWKDANIWNMSGNITWDNSRQAWKAVGYAAMYLKPEYAAAVDKNQPYTISVTAMRTNDEGKTFYWGGDRLDASRAHLAGYGGTYDYSATGGSKLVPLNVWTTYKKDGKTGTAASYDGWGADGCTYYRVGGLINYNGTNTQVTYIKDIVFRTTNGGLAHTPACYTDIVVHGPNNTHVHNGTCTQSPATTTICNNLPLNSGGGHYICNNLPLSSGYTPCPYCGGTNGYTSYCYDCSNHGHTHRQCCNTCGQTSGCDGSLGISYNGVFAHTHTASCIAPHTTHTHVPACYVAIKNYTCNNLPLNTNAYWSCNNLPINAGGWTACPYCGGKSGYTSYNYDCSNHGDSTRQRCNSCGQTSACDGSLGISYLGAPTHNHTGTCQQLYSTHTHNASCTYTTPMVWSCNNLPLNTHVCDSMCVNTRVLNCTEPHHIGQHYDFSSQICYTACNNDDNHRQKQTIAIPGLGDFSPGNFINLDYPFEIYFPNKGDFYGDGAYGIAATTGMPGKGYTNNMSTTEWTAQKSVEFEFDVIYNGMMYRAGEEIFIDVPTTTFTFYCPLNNPEAISSQIKFRAYANNGTGMDNDDERNRTRYSYLDAKHSAYKETYIDVVGRIGNLVIEDTGDFRFADFFKIPKNPVEWIIPNVVKAVHHNMQNNIIGDNIDIRGETIAAGTGWLNTYGKLGHLDRQPVSFPLSPEKNNIPALKTQPLRIGYPVFSGVSTIGNYYDDMQIIPYYYWMNLGTKQIQPVDIYMNFNGEYKMINSNGACVPGWDPSIVHNNRVHLNWDEESARRNYSPEEKTTTESIAQIKGREAADGSLQWLGTPAGKCFYYGNNQLMQLKDRNRTFIGSSSTNGQNKNPGSLIPEDDFQFQAQRWHYTIGLPSSAVAVPHGQLPTQSNIDTLRVNTGVLIIAADIKPKGQVYTLDYKHTCGNDPVVINGVSYPLSGIAQPVIAIMSAHKSSADDMETVGSH